MDYQSRASEHDFTCVSKAFNPLLSSWLRLDGHAVLRQPVLSVHPKTMRYSSAYTEECFLNAVMSNKPALVKAFGKAAATVLSQSGCQQPCC